VGGRHNNEEEKVAYIKLEGDLDDGVPIDNEAASDSARDLMRSVNKLTDHCEAFSKVLKTIPPSFARQMAEIRIEEAKFWAGRAFIESET
jgi:hypothetical protein